MDDWNLCNIVVRPRPRHCIWNIHFQLTMRFFFYFFFLFNNFNKWENIKLVVMTDQVRYNHLRTI